MDNEPEIFTGPETFDRLHGAVGPGWEVEEHSLNGAVFYYPYPDTVNLVTVGAEMEKFIEDQEPERNYVISEDFRGVNERGQINRWFTLHSEWPVSIRLLSLLDEVSMKIEQRGES